MPWQIQARRGQADQWEPISVERPRLIAGIYQRQYEYESIYDAKLAFKEYVDVEGSLPNLLVRMATGAAKFTDRYDVRFVQFCSEQQASGPPIPDLAAQPDSTTEKFNRIENEYRTHRIGVHDYASLVSCLRSNFKQVFGDDEPLSDPQDMIQRLVVEIQNLQRLKGGGMQGHESDVRVLTDQEADMLEALREVPAWFEEWHVPIGTAEETLLGRVNAAIMRTEAAAEQHGRK